MARILIVDDSPTQLFAIRRIVEKLGHETITAEDGVVGIGLAKTQRPDLILMDVVMPNLNGFQATRTLKRDSATRHIPVVLVTTKDQDIDRMWGMRQGAKAYITKPFSEAELTEIIKVVLEESPAGLLNTPSRPSPPVGTPSTPPTPSIQPGMPPSVLPASTVLPGSSTLTVKSSPDTDIPQNPPPVQNIASPSPYPSAYPSPANPVIPTPPIGVAAAAQTTQTIAPLPPSPQNIFDSPVPAPPTQPPSVQSATSLTDDLPGNGPVSSLSPKQDSNTAITRVPAASPAPVAQDAISQDAGIPPLPDQTSASDQASWPVPSVVSKESVSIPVPSEESTSADSVVSSSDGDYEELATPLSETTMVAAIPSEPPSPEPLPSEFHSSEPPSESFSETEAVGATSLESPSPEPFPSEFHAPESLSEPFSEGTTIESTSLELPSSEFHSPDSPSESLEEDIWGQPLPVNLLTVSEHIPDIPEPSLRVISDEIDPILDEDMDSMTWRPPVVPPLPIPDDLPIPDSVVSSDSEPLGSFDDPASVIDSSPWPRPVESSPPALPEGSPFEEEKGEELPSQPRRGGILSRLPWRWNTSVPSSPPPRAPPWTLEPGAPDLSPKRPTDKDKNKKK
jgi:twitching motility two-component system response regulator PilH